MPEIDDCNALLSDQEHCVTHNAWWPPGEDHCKSWPVVSPLPVEPAPTTAGYLTREEVDEYAEVYHDAEQAAALNPEDRFPFSDLPATEKSNMRAAIRAVLAHAKEKNS